MFELAMARTKQTARNEVAGKNPRSKLATMSMRKDATKSVKSVMRKGAATTMAIKPTPYPSPSAKEVLSKRAKEVLSKRVKEVLSNPNHMQTDMHNSMDSCLDGLVAERNESYLFDLHERSRWACQYPSIGGWVIEEDNKLVLRDTVQCLCYPRKRKNRIGNLAATSPQAPPAIAPQTPAISPQLRHDVGNWDGNWEWGVGYKHESN